LLQLGFKASKADVSLFIFNVAGIQIYMLIYIDDIIIISSSTAATEKFLAQLRDDFPSRILARSIIFLALRFITLLKASF
jgi:hypothetical protein